MANLIKIDGVQMDIALKDKAANRARIEDHLHQAASSGVLLTVFPECALSGYCFESREEARSVAEEVPGPSTEGVAKLCERLSVYAVFGVVELAGDDLFNSCVLVGPGGVLGRYRKIHLPFLGLDRFATHGDRPYQVYEVEGIRLGMNICYDVAFPEAARVMALQGADLIVLPTNWPPKSECAADHLIHARAMENNVYYMAVNRVGTERGFPFIGHSRVCAPDGTMMDEATHRREAKIHAEIDVEKARNKHLVRVPGQHEINRIKDRRPEMYGILAEPQKIPNGE